MPTGAKLFLILSAALLPLALIAMFATLKTGRAVDAETRARLRVAAIESTRAIAIELIGDMTALRAAVAALGTDPADGSSCARAQGVFAQQSGGGGGTRFVITNARGKTLCGQPFPDVSIARSGLPIDAAIIPGQGLMLVIDGPRGANAQAWFPRSFLARIGAPTASLTGFSSALATDDRSLLLEAREDEHAYDRVETMRTSLGIAGLDLVTSDPSAPITSSLVIALLLPLLMWA
ncbi:MAG TPA: histidine kinase, partial [Sphingomonas sp.]|nr:histidine kinase [Sphingomonas sp.]